VNTLEECVDAALSVLQSRTRDGFTTSPLTFLRDLGLKVRASENLAQTRHDGGSCDGMSFLKDDVILYAPTESRRENFTLAHELGHWLVYQVDDIYDWLDDQPEPEVALETLCDRIASRLLVPDTVLRQVIGDGPVRASHVADLFRGTSASLPVCSIALASQLPTLGAAIILRHSTGAVEYASIHPDPERGWPKVRPWPGQPTPPAHPLRGLATGASLTRRSFWAMPWGSQASFYIDAVAGANRTVAVLADTDLWSLERFHPVSTREFDDRPELEIRCCGVTRSVRAYPCSECHEPHCPQCGRCRCDRRAAVETRCAGPCGLQYMPHLLTDGLCEQCG
jgi:hypothetical protein